MHIKKIKPKYCILILLFFNILKLNSQINLYELLGDYNTDANHLSTFNGPIINTYHNVKTRFVYNVPITSCDTLDILDSINTTGFHSSGWRIEIRLDSTFWNCGSSINYNVSGKYFPNDSIYIKLRNGPNPDFYEFFGKKIQTQTGISNNSLLNTHLQVYPNPANDKVYLNGVSEQSNTNTLLYNSMGVIVSAKNNATEIDVLNLPNGIYCLKIQYTKSVISKKIIVQH